MAKIRVNLPGRGKIFEHWENYLNERWFHPIDFSKFDFKKPICLACKRQMYIKKKTKDVYKNWDSANGLERHHIITREKGGTDTPDNLFLLCYKCHDLAPTNCTKEQFLKWAICQSYERRRITEFYMTIESMLLPKDVILFKRWMGELMKNKEKFEELYQDFIDTSTPHYDGRYQILPMSNFAISLLEIWKEEIGFYN